MAPRNVNMLLPAVAVTIALLASARPITAQPAFVDYYTSFLTLETNLKNDTLFGTVATVLATNLAKPLAQLANTSGVTLLAPTNQAFTKLGVPTLSCLLNQPGLTLLSAVLEYHVIPRVYTSRDLLAASPVGVPSLVGALLNFTTQGSSVFVNGVPVVAPDAAQLPSSYDVHGISSVLIPPVTLQDIQTYCSSGCSSNPCGVGGACTPTPSGSLTYTCVCSDAFVFNGGTCIPRPIEPYHTS